ncbi:MAG: acyltransferase family protein [Oscillospiraceae bacterium]|nr:acyltransferase family protein [Oscillospiraceae bacterium]
MRSGLPSARDYSLDNIRFFLIFSVVFAHLLEVCSPFWGSQSIYKFIYSFHMPAFLFLFGYHIKYSPKRIVYRWCIPYVFFQSVYLLFARYVLKLNLEVQYTTPYWLLWYMLVCIYDQLLLPLFDTADKRRQVAAMLCVLIISLLIGYEDSVGYPLSLSRFFVFQPWFLLGFYCKKNRLLERFSAQPRGRLAAIFLSAAMIVFLAPYISKAPNGLLYGSYSYSNCGGTPWMRGMVFFMSLSVIVFLFVGLKPYLGRKLPLITNIGQNTWPIFLLHGFIVKSAPVYFPALLTTPWKVILLSCAIVMLAGSKLCSNAIYYACFSWLEKLPAASACKEHGG